MSEWWTYTLADFLLFSPRTYYRLYEIYNAAIWPAQLVALGLGAWIGFLVRRGTDGDGRGRKAGGRVVAAILSTAWLWVGVAFLAKRYATINTAGSHFAWAFGIEAALLLGAGVLGGRLLFEKPDDLGARAGLAIFGFALLLEPLAAPLFGRGWKGLEIFGLAPDPTAVGTLGLLLAARMRHRWLLMGIPLLWCVVAGGFLLAMKASDFWIAPAAALLSVVLASRQARARRRARSGGEAA